MSRIILFLIFLTICMVAACGDKEDDDPVSDPPKIAISNVTLFEGNENSKFRFKVTTSFAYDQEIKVDFSTKEVTAGAGVDFSSTSGTLTIPSGGREGFIEIEILADTLKEQDEQFQVVLSNPVNARIQTGEGIGTIRNDDTFVEIPADGYITPENYTGYNVAWRDEFGGSALNTSDWTHEIGAGGWGNQELQFYTDRTDNSYVTNGNLVIEAKKESFSGSPYTSARIITKDKKGFTHGRVDIRAILPEGQGIWPALWMLGTNISTIGWPACGEIDIMELVGHEPSIVHGTAHWGPQGQGFSNNNGNGSSLSGEKFSEKYHVFSIIWEFNSIEWYVDDNKYFSLSNTDVNGNYPFNDEFFFIFNIAVGGEWPGSPDASTVFPQHMYVDYIRVFQKL